MRARQTWMLVLVLSWAAPAAAQEWEGLTPLTRSQLEPFYGPSGQCKIEYVPGLKEFGHVDPMDGYTIRLREGMPRLLHDSVMRHECTHALYDLKIRNGFPGWDEFAPHVHQAYYVLESGAPPEEIVATLQKMGYYGPGFYERYNRVRACSLNAARAEVMSRVLARIEEADNYGSGHISDKSVKIIERTLGKDRSDQMAGICSKFKKARERAHRGLPANVPGNQKLLCSSASTVLKKTGSKLLKRAGRYARIAAECGNEGVPVTPGFATGGPIELSAMATAGWAACLSNRDRNQALEQLMLDPNAPVNVTTQGVRPELYLLNCHLQNLCEDVLGPE